MPDERGARGPSVEALYQELILHHYRRPRNRGTLDDPATHIAMKNPLCGDELELHVAVDDQGIVRDARFTGRGCSISQASASMMTQLVKGKTMAEVEALKERFTAVMHGDPEAAKDRALGDLRALSGVAKFPARVKCALLGWEGVAAALRLAGGRDASGAPGQGGSGRCVAPQKHPGREGQTRPETSGTAETSELRTAPGIAREHGNGGEGRPERR